ncbi:hypothetical protein [Proteus faecis]|uniref:hypothetical protein n=1 Tax=Proteus faecis TaxID=2050967 RepID=UPI00301E05B9
MTKVALEGCALAAPCRGFVAKKVLEYGVKAGITAIVAKEIADNISSDDLDHLITLNMMGNDEITNRYLDYLSGKYATSVQSPDISSQLPGYPIPTPLPPLPGTPIPEQDKDDGKLITPIIDPADQRPNHTGHDDGFSDIDIKNDTGGNQILDKDWWDYILTADNKITRSDHAEIRN